MEVGGWGQPGIPAAQVERKSSPRDRSSAASCVRGEDSPATAAASTLRIPPLQVRSLPARVASPRVQLPPRAAVCEPGRGLPLAGEVCGRAGQTEVPGRPPRCSAENIRSPCPQQRGLAPESLTDFSSIPSAPLDVFTLAPGAFPILLVRNLLRRAPSPAQAPERRGGGGW